MKELLSLFSKLPEPPAQARQSKHSRYTKADNRARNRAREKQRRMHNRRVAR